MRHLFEELLPSYCKSNEEEVDFALQYLTEVDQSNPGVQRIQSAVQQRKQDAALLARVGDGRWVQVGKSTTFIADRDGRLDFTINDSDKANNEGYYWVDYVVE